MMDTQRYLDNLIKTTDSLIGVLETETACVKARESDKIRSIYSEKIRLSYLYEEHMKVLAESPDLIKAASPEQKEKLEELAYAFEEAARENLKMLKAAHETGQKVLDVIRKAVEESQENVHGYAGNGAGTCSKADGRNLALSLDESL